VQVSLPPDSSIIRTTRRPLSGHGHGTLRGANDPSVTRVLSALAQDSRTHNNVVYAWGKASVGRLGLADTESLPMDDGEPYALPDSTEHAG
jgi:hypothetical protein